MARLDGSIDSEIRIVFQKRRRTGELQHADADPASPGRALSSAAHCLRRFLSFRIPNVCH